MSRLLLDENCGRKLAEALAEAGHDTVLVADTPVRGLPDPMFFCTPSLKDESS